LLKYAHGSTIAGNEEKSLAGYGIVAGNAGLFSSFLGLP
jgi:hypothetical protein